MWRDVIGSGECRSTKETRRASVPVTTAGTTATKQLQYSVVKEEVNGVATEMAVFEGDIVLGSVDQLEQLSRQVEHGIEPLGIIIRGAGYRWPDRTIVYEIASDLPSSDRVVQAVEHWTAHTTIKFRKRNTEQDYVIFRPSNGCSSSVGKQGGRQFVNLGEACTAGNVIHEIGHTVGLWHEQSRSDRDQWVTIDWTNILEGLEHNFDQQIQDGEDLGPYDYGSIMHYPPRAFAKDPNKPTIVPLKQGAANMGQREALSQGDINAVTTAYG